MHGFGNNSNVWKSYIELFTKEGFEVIAPNLRFHGHGEEITRLGEVSLLDYMEDLETLINSFEKPPIIVGYSM